MKDYLLHMRPRSWPIVAAHCTAGFLCGATMAGSPVLWWRLPLAAVGWGILLNGGTLALNSAFDNDTGAIGYLDDPPPVPAGLAVFGVALIMSGFAVAAVLGKAYMAAYAVCAVMSALYSCPPIRLKAVAGADVAINCTGYGALTFYSGWAASGAELGAAGWYAVSGFFLLFGALYPLTQIYQIESDAAAGDLTLAVFLGRKVSLVVSAVCAVAAFLCFAGSVGGFGIRGFVPLVPGALFWGILLAVWLAGRVRREKKGMYRALYAWALTDMGLVTAFLVFGTGAGRL